MKIPKKVQSFVRILAILSVLTILQTPTTIKSDIPELKGLYNLFKPDYIGIGQALKLSQWIENVWTYAPKNNLAKQLIKEFWHKRSEYDQFLTTKKAPVYFITPQILGKLIKFSTDPKKYKKEEVEKTLLKETIDKLKSDIKHVKNLKNSIQNFAKKQKDIGKFDKKIKYFKRLSKEIQTLSKPLDNI
ncbi:hypothetical protein ACFLYU_04575 [Candidatus Dependentiae bacterium]